ncbi:MAG: hypothetical protein WD688_04280 [Candidatus Binatia bacterium]
MEAKKDSRVYSEGIVAGLIGAATIAIWFFVVDSVNGGPLHTPMVLGSTIFGRTASVATMGELPISFEIVFMYNWVHALVFCAIGGIASKLIDLAEDDANLGFGVLLLFVVFEFGFLAAAFLYAEPVLQALAWPAVLVGNLLAAGAMAGYFWRRHPRMVIRP